MGEKAAFSEEKGPQIQKQKNDRHQSETCSEKTRRREMGKMDGVWRRRESPTVTEFSFRCFIAVALWEE